MDLENRIARILERAKADVLAAVREVRRSSERDPELFDARGRLNREGQDRISAMIVAGQRDADIARDLHITPSAVNKWRRSILPKKREQLSRIFGRSG